MDDSSCLRNWVQIRFLFLLIDIVDSGVSIITTARISGLYVLSLDVYFPLCVLLFVFSD